MGSKAEKKQTKKNSNNYTSGWSHRMLFLFVACPFCVTVPEPHCRSGIFCWWCPLPDQRRQTPPGWVRGGGLRFLASTVGTTKPNRHVHIHTHAYTHIEKCMYTSTQTNQQRETQEKERWLISFRSKLYWLKTVTLMSAPFIHLQKKKLSLKAKWQSQKRWIHSIQSTFLFKIEHWTFFLNLRTFNTIFFLDIAETYLLTY